MLLFLRKLPLGSLTPTRLLCLSFHSFLPDVAGSASGGTSFACRGILANCPERVIGGLFALLRFPTEAPRALQRPKDISLLIHNASPRSKPVFYRD